jgi:hypothetical protein
MPRFKVPVGSKTPEQTLEALKGAGMDRFGPAFSPVTRDPESEWSAAPKMTAFVEATTADAAEARVREIVGTDCEVGPAAQELDGQ